MINLLDEKGKNNFLFLASVIAHLCEEKPLTVKLKDVEKFWKVEISRLQYEMVAGSHVKDGTITFSLKEKNG